MLVLILIAAWLHGIAHGLDADTPRVLRPVEVAGAVGAGGCGPDRSDQPKEAAAATAMADVFASFNRMNSGR